MLLQDHLLWMCNVRILAMYSGSELPSNCLCYDLQLHVLVNNCYWLSSNLHDTIWLPFMQNAWTEENIITCSRAHNVVFNVVVVRKLNLDAFSLFVR